MASFPPTVSVVDGIAAFPDPVIRNLQITQCYHELSSALAERTGPKANWCTFATWASKQAGQTIRKEDLRRALEEALHRSAATQQAALAVASEVRAVGAMPGALPTSDLVWEAWSPLGVFDRASDAVGRGNQKVFAEIGREFARFMAACLSDAAPNEERIAGFCAGLAPGDPPDGQRYLRQAFRRIYQAFFTADPKARSELLLLANLEIGLHEQTRLQPEILTALDALFVDQEEFMRRLWKAILRRGGLLAWLRWLIMRLLGRQNRLENAIQAFLAAVRRQARLILTETMMTIHIPPDIRLRLGVDLTNTFPDSLRHIEHPDLRALLAQIDPTPDSTAGSGAHDWAALPERMHFIADMFRCYQESSDLFTPPYTADQVTALKSNRLPHGRL